MSDLGEWIGLVFAAGTVATGLVIAIGKSWVLERMKAAIEL